MTGLLKIRKKRKNYNLGLNYGWNENWEIYIIIIIIRMWCLKMKQKEWDMEIGKWEDRDKKKRMVNQSKLTIPHGGSKKVISKNYYPITRSYVITHIVRMV